MTPTSSKPDSPDPPPQARSERTRQAILAATREILAEVGVRALTVEGVAARSAVAKTTIYRRWRGKDELALAVLIDMVQSVSTTPDLGETRRELITFVGKAVKILDTTLMGRVMQGLVSDLATSPELAAAFRTRVVALRISETRRVLDRGIARGELRPDLDVELVHELLFGPVYYRLLLSGAPLDRRLAERLVDAVMPALLRKPSNRSARSVHPG
jgi:AcrR family transcriptional regulator